MIQNTNLVTFKGRFNISNPGSLKVNESTCLENPNTVDPLSSVVRH